MGTENQLSISNLKEITGADLSEAPEDFVLVSDGQGAAEFRTRVEGPNPFDKAKTFVGLTSQTGNMSTLLAGSSLSATNTFPESGRLLAYANRHY